MEEGHRADLDGLRAVAVALVVAHHLGVLPGGFVGVDVFFVLSGFLVTGSLLRDPGASLSLFLSRRVRRLAPAATVVILSVLFAAHLLALPRALSETRAAAAAAAGRAANFYFAWGREEGYFSAIGSPLLHLW
jgi:peptidoglycan/LPS O-acetylase OafA/YrhL